MADWYRTYLIDTERSAALWVLIGFLVTYAITRSITLRIRRRGAEPQPETPQDGEGGGLINDIHIGGVHVHHQVWGILLVLVTGLLEFRYSPGHPVRRSSAHCSEPAPRSPSTSSRCGCTSRTCTGPRRARSRSTP